MERKTYVPYSMQVKVPRSLKPADRTLRWIMHPYDPSSLDATGIWVIEDTLDGYEPTVGSVCIIQSSSNPRNLSAVVVVPGMKLGPHPASPDLDKGSDLA